MYSLDFSLEVVVEEVYWTGGRDGRTRAALDDPDRNFVVV